MSKKESEFIKSLKKELKKHWEDTKEERERTHTGALYEKFLKKMKNRKMVFGAILLLFAITGICNIPNVSADEVDIPALSYVYYNMGYLERNDKILINEIDSDGTINVYIMNEIQFNTLQDSGGLTWNYLKRWQDTIYLSGWSFDITENGYYYVVLYNKALLTGRTVYVDIDISYYSEPADGGTNIFWNLLLFIVIPIVAIVLVIAIPIILIRRHKRKSPKEPIMIF